MAKPNPSAETPLSAWAILMELIPMTCPAILTNGPPELPGLIAASVCKALMLVTWLLSVRLTMFLFLAEIIP